MGALPSVPSRFVPLKGRNDEIYLHPRRFVNFYQFFAFRASYIRVAILEISKFEYVYSFTSNKSLFCDEKIEA